MSQKSHQMLDSAGCLRFTQVEEKREHHREFQRRIRIWKWSHAWPSRGVWGAHVMGGLREKAKGVSVWLGVGPECHVQLYQID